MSIIKSLVLIALSLTLFTFLTAHAHESHTHKAPWQACKTKKLTQQCEFENGKKDLHKGTCQLFSGSLMCVRNQPIIHAEVINKRISTKAESETPDPFQ